MVVVMKFKSALPTAVNVVTVLGLLQVSPEKHLLCQERHLSQIVDSLFLLKQCNLRYICASDSIKFNVRRVRFHKVDEFSICCFAGLEKLGADGFEAGVTVWREEARGCSCPLLCWQMQEWCQLDGMEGKQESAAENSLCPC